MTVPGETMRGLRVDEVAVGLDVHPFDVVRMLAVSGGLPRDLRLDGEDVANLRALGGLETWWGDDLGVDLDREGPLPLLRALAAQLITRGVVEPRFTRADNLFRGLAPEPQGILRRWVNALIRERYLATRMSPHGLQIAVCRSGLGDVELFASQGMGVLATLAGRQ